jgi:hypothetical protein
MWRHSDCHDRELEIVAAIDPKRSIRRSAAPPTPRSDMASPPRAEFLCDVPDHKEDVSCLEPYGSNTEEVTGPDIRFMPLQELSPSRGWPSIVARTHVLGHGPGGNSKSQSCELRLNPSLTPEPVFSGHPADERLKFPGNWPSPTSPVLPI